MKRVNLNKNNMCYKFALQLEIQCTIFKGGSAVGFLRDFIRFFTGFQKPCKKPQSFVKSHKIS